MSAPDAPVTISICVCTFRRRHVRDTLISLGRLSVPDDARVDVVVADNDAEPSARAHVEAAAATLPWPVTYVHAPAGNISIARNACLETATGDLVAFIDDDEQARPGWLGELLAVLRREGAAAVLGPVQAGYDPSAPAWMRRHDFHSTFPVFVRGEIRTGYTCNVLIDRRLDAVAALRFDLGRGRSGGEDTDYFTRLHGTGGRIAYAPEAWIDEPVPGTRARFGWLAQRRFRMGQTHGHLLREGGAGRLAGAVLAAAKVGACLGLALATAPWAGRWRRNLLRGVLHAGTISGLVGLREIDQYGGSVSGRERTSGAA